ncbi:MAG: hypothetical protein COV07_01585 [Candidatus Vogelbacteria bacterium CG10_big_fil_rev_8_21_14_0_10_45_14]|uniref:Uncharacterized protein n=1 Tax=Candidatus Vogelbacteria bacterium CG10_big_fil_rev_8_21_14_0_10_45_14 TaxID=1975042 RepID=A0A2H0RKH8_9BACT|nr:MAG: hypothetical protein COV07_01585 [Candidatus Vogelbacteria bacterium CG10_big_fil_rev_8_21_14_0_10_45_14]
MTLGEFARKHKTLFWSTNAYDQLDERAVVEAVLNYGDWETVRELADIIGYKKMASVFSEDAHLPRSNYYPKIVSYFDRFFKKYA